MYLMVINIFFLHVGEELQCLNGFPRMRDNQRQMVRRIGNFNTIRLIPEMNFTCNGTVEKVMVAGKIQKGSNRIPMQLQIWRPENNITEQYRRVNNISLSPMSDSLNSIGKLRIIDDVIPVYECKLNMKVLVEPGDILGIELPHRRNTGFELYSITESQLTNYIFKHGQSNTTLDLSKSDKETTSQPLIRLEIKFKQGIYNTRYSLIVKISYIMQQHQSTL